MKQAVRHYAPVAGLLAGIVAVSALLTLFTGSVGRQKERLQVMTTVAPLRAAAMAVIGDVDEVELTHLSGSGSGCLHDYQLSPADRLALQQADLLLLNGAGAEAFLADLLPTLSATTVDTSAGLTLLCGDHHDHEGHHHEESVNEHVWTSPTYYAHQVERVTAALCELDPAHAATYTANGKAYAARVRDVGERLRQAVAKLPTTTCVTFHSSLIYFAQDIGLTPAATLQIGEDAGISAADLSAAQQVLATQPQALLLYDSQYPLRYEALTGAAVVLDTAVTDSDWLAAMEENVRKLTEAGL
ncbi:MAG: zinc ABC transporter substrate-binding protein [Clostridia bacterium]|nr:zinc ABC transporter substrate-binding protein [Clostridia bacterium]